MKQAILAHVFNLVIQYTSYTNHLTHKNLFVFTQVKSELQTHSVPGSTVSQTETVPYSGRDRGKALRDEHLSYSFISGATATATAHQHSAGEGSQSAVSHLKSL